MAYYENSNPFSVCFNMLKMRYAYYEESIFQKKFISPNDKVNVFINVETILKHLSMIVDLDKKILLQKDFNIIMISDMLNLAAHYKRFFKSNGLDTNVFLYQTDLSSTTFKQTKYNEDFRSYYLIKYNENPKFISLSDAYKKSILPELQTYCDFIPNVYFINAKNIEGSLVPYIIARHDVSRKNFIIGGELFDTQYTLLPNFVNHCIHKVYGGISRSSTISEYMDEITKKNPEDVESFLNTYSTYSMYCSLLSAVGDRNRSIDGLSGIGIKTLQKYIEQGLQNHIINKDTSNPTLIGNIFKDDDIKDDYINNFYCTSILEMYQELDESDNLSIINQCKDRLDNNTLLKLNSTRFYNYNLILESLLM